MNNPHPQIKEIDYNYISDGIYIGTNQCCQTHFSERLGKEGITADVSLEKERVDAPFGVDFYLWLPVEDQTAPTFDQFDFGVAALEKFAAMKIKVYVHCEKGHGRAPTLVAAYFMKQGKSFEEAAALIKLKRPMIHIQDVQIKALKQWIQR